MGFDAGADSDLENLSIIVEGKYHRRDGKRSEPFRVNIDYSLLIGHVSMFFPLLKLAVHT